MLFTFFSISIIVCAWCAVCLLLLLHLFIAHAYCFICFLLHNYFIFNGCSYISLLLNLVFYSIPLLPFIIQSNISITFCFFALFFLCQFSNKFSNICVSCYSKHIQLNEIPNLLQLNFALFHITHIVENVPRKKQIVFRC